jgi:perosamine synthetase
MMSLVPRDRWDHSIGDLFSAFGAALRPRENGRGLPVAGLGMTIPVRSGRAGLIVAIRALDLRPGARVGVPLFCCPVVFHSIVAAGCAVRFIDVDPETYCLSPDDLAAKRSQIDAVVAVHMFGHLCEMEKLKEAAGGKPIIEDCAQALGSRLNGRPAGSFGDVAFFSFRSGKYISAGEGGALYSGDTAVSSRTSQIVGELPVSGRASDCAHAAKVYLKSLLRSRPLYGLAGYRLWRIYNKRICQSDNQSIALGQISRADLMTIQKRLPSLPVWVDRQRANADYFARHLQLDHGMLCAEKPGTFYNRYLYPIKFPSAETRDLAAAHLFRRRIDSMKYLDDIADVAAVNFGYSGDCPVAEGLAKRVLVIPGYHGLKEKDVEKIAKSVNSAWAEITRASDTPGRKSRP